MFVVLYGPTPQQRRGLKNRGGQEVANFQQTVLTILTLALNFAKIRLHPQILYFFGKKILRRKDIFFDRLKCTWGRQQLPLLPSQHPGYAAFRARCL